MKKVRKISNIAVSLIIAIILVTSLAISAVASQLPTLLPYGINYSKSASCALDGMLPNWYCTATISVPNGDYYLGDDLHINLFAQYFNTVSNQYYPVMQTQNGLTVQNGRNVCTAQLSRPTDTSINRYVWNGIEASYYASDGNTWNSTALHIGFPIIR